MINNYIFIQNSIIIQEYEYDHIKLSDFFEKC